eukprot:3467603-Ditylum_brightwellii.AAC.1
MLPIDHVLRGLFGQHSIGIGRCRCNILRRHRLIWTVCLGGTGGWVRWVVAVQIAEYIDHA